MYGEIYLRVERGVMKRKTILEAKSAAERFISLVDPALKAFCSESDILGNYQHYPSKHTAALKRASLDLTRLLADMRQDR